MKEASTQSVFVAAGNDDTVEMVSGILDKEGISIEAPSKAQSMIKAFDAGTAQVLVFAFKQVEQSMKLAELFRAKSRRFRQESCRLVLLCDKLEAKQAYQLCREEVFDNYVVFWPLSFDPFRLSMAINQEFYELEQQRETQSRLDKLDGQQLVVSELEQILSRQLGGGQDLAGHVRSLLPLSSDPELNGVEPETPSPNAFHEQMKKLDATVRDFESLSSASLRSLRLALNKVKKSNGTILLVEGDASYRALMTTILKSCDFQVLGAGTVAAAVSLLQDHAPDLVLMDILMPDMNGPDAIRAIKSNEWMEAVPVIIISGQNQKSIIVECVRLGAAAFVVKPFSQQLLMDKVHGVLNLPKMVPA